MILGNSLFVGVVVNIFVGVFREDIINSIIHYKQHKHYGTRNE